MATYVQSIARQQHLRQRLLLIGCLLLMLGGLARPARPAAATGSNWSDSAWSLRLLTYNTAFVSLSSLLIPGGEINPNVAQWQMEYPERADHIADGILRTDQDVVALNEVFDDKARDQLILRLSARYPYHIDKIDGPTNWPLPPGILETPDSGLMLFSKYPFVPFSAAASAPFPGGADISGVNYVGGQWVGWGDDPNEVAVLYYDECASTEVEAGSGIYTPTTDCFAAKAVALVRVATPRGTANIAFTHMQASYTATESEEMKTRDHQLGQARQLIVRSLTQTQLRNEPVFLMGDLNITGQNQNGSQSSAEWKWQFATANNAASGFFACAGGTCSYDPSTDTGAYMADSWGYETSKDDVGISRPDEQHRLDYILHNQPLLEDRGALCLQHIALAYDLGEQSGVQQYSDHLGVRGDFNRGAPFCNPNHAKPVTFGSYSSPQDVSFGPGNSALITFPGSMQWFRIDQPGSYSIQVGGPEVGFDIYSADDLSRPLASYHNETSRWGKKYALPKPPYFIRTYAQNPTTKKPDRTWVGGYTIMFHQHRGNGPQDAIALTPGNTDTFLWPTGGIVTPDHKVWYSFYTDTASAGGFPDVQFFQESTSTDFLQAQHLDLVADTQGYPAISWASAPTQPGDWDNNQWPDRRTSAPHLSGKPSGGAQRYYVRMQRDQLYAGIGMRAGLRFETNLTYIRPLTLVPAQTADWVGFPSAEDEQINAVFQFDADNLYLSCTNAPCTDLGEFHNDFKRSLVNEPALKGSISKALRLELIEDEGEATVDYLHGEFNDSYIKPNPAWQGGVQNSLFVWNDNPNPDKASYWYTMYYLASHSECVVVEADPSGCKQ